MGAGALLKHATIAFTLLQSVSSLTLDTSNDASIKNAASTIAFDLMKYYTGNVTNTPSTIAVLPSPYYWWEAGAMWGTMLDYYHFTGDSSYNDVTTQALESQVGPNFDFMMEDHQKDEGNDDQAFWGFAIMSAAEKNFPEPTNTGGFTWLQLTENMWNSIAARWDTSTCNGGLKWQIFTFNNGYDYKNSVSNGAFFQLSARLARFTGNQTYIDWAEKVYEWTSEVGLIDTNFKVYDGADDTKNCSSADHTTWTYNNAIFLYGSAVMYNVTEASSLWKTRTQGFLTASANFFSPYSNSTNIMFEQACETVNTCDNDQFSFKAYLARFMWATTQMAPFTQSAVSTYLTTSASAAAQACSGDGDACGVRWYVGGYDGVTGVGQQMSALECIQGLLISGAAPPSTGGQASKVSPSSTVSPVTVSSAASVVSSVVSSTSLVASSSSAVTALSGAVLVSVPTSSATASTAGAAGAIVSGSSSSMVVITDTILASTTVPCTTNSSSILTPYPTAHASNATASQSPTVVTIKTLLTTTVPCSNTSSYYPASSFLSSQSSFALTPTPATPVSVPTSKLASSGISIDTSAAPTPVANSISGATGTSSTSSVVSPSVVTTNDGGRVVVSLGFVAAGLVMGLVI